MQLLKKDDQNIEDIGSLSSHDHLEHLDFVLSSEGIKEELPLG